MDSSLVSIIGFVVGIALFLAVLQLFSIERSLKQIAGVLNLANLGDVAADIAWLKEAKAAEIRRTETPQPTLR